MNNQFSKVVLLPLGLISALAMAVVTFNKPTEAQQNFIAVADGNMTEYKSSTAPVINPGDSSQIVRDIQLLLRDNNFYYGAIDGVYGSRMRSSIISFQRSRNLNANAVINDETWEALIDLDKRTSPSGFVFLEKYSASSAPMLRLGSRGQAVRDVQTFLKQQGFYVGQVDGIYGRSTAAAVKSFQQNRAKLKADGIVGDRTWQAMINDKKGPFAIN